MRVQTEELTAEDGVDYDGVNREVVLEAGVSTAPVLVKLHDRGEYQKHSEFRIRVWGVQPPHVVMGADSCRVTITEDPNVRRFYEKVTALINVGTKTAAEQTFLSQVEAAFELPGTGGLEMGMHFLALPWKVICLVVPPTSVWQGKAAFLVALTLIGMVTAVVAEAANMLGCSLGLEAPVTAITFVALGTSLPDTFASKLTAEEDETADAAVGNVTGSNSVNVFLGLGLPWVIASLYKAAKGESYTYPASGLVFSVVLFLCCATVGLLLLMANRVVYGGELGGPRRHIISALLVILWVVYVLLSSLKVSCCVLAAWETQPHTHTLIVHTHTHGAGPGRLRLVQLWLWKGMLGLWRETVGEEIEGASLHPISPPTCRLMQRNLTRQESSTSLSREIEYSNRAPPPPPPPRRGWF